VKDRRAATAGAVAALVWAAAEPLDRRLFRSRYSDVEMLGKLVTRTRLWPLAGLAVHAANGAAFGAAANRLRIRPFALAMVENVALFPLAAVVDRRHPARDELGPLFTARGFAQATFRHALFGTVLGFLLREKR
jgi:hypothetical protein